jgi:hypothetical protein
LPPHQVVRDDLVERHHLRIVHCVGRGGP